MANADAVPLLLALLREARPPVQAWGLAALLRILRGSTANLSACDRCAAAAWLLNDLEETFMSRTCWHDPEYAPAAAARQYHTACLPACWHTASECISRRSLSCFPYL